MSFYELWFAWTPTLFNEMPELGNYCLLAGNTSFLLETYKEMCTRELYSMQVCKTVPKWGFTLGTTVCSMMVSGLV